MTSLSLAAVLAEPARRTPEKVAVVEGDLRVTYADLWRDARRYAAALLARGIAPGTRVGLLAPNVVDFIRGYYGILAAGGTVVPVPTLLNGDEAAYILGHSGAQALLYEESYAAVAVQAAASAGIEAWPVEGFGHGEPVPTYATREAEDPAVIFYTSGTTGRPKGAVLTHLNLVMNSTVNAFDANPIRREDVVMGCLPLFHTFGQTVSMNSTFRVGATLLLQPRFDAAAAIEVMYREQATLFFGVPTMYVQLLEAARSADVLPRLRDCVSGGASLPVAVLEQFEKAFDTTVYEGYGLSETSPTATVNQPWFGTRAGTVGHPIWGVEVEIADETLDDRIVLLGTGELGEIVIRGHNVFAGYLDNPEATDQAIVDGWFRTGDIGTKDSEGFITIVDRKKDLIIRGGFNVYPREVEEVLMRHPAVAQVAVIGIPDDEKGEEVCAVVIVHDGASLDSDELVAWSREQLGRHKYPRHLEIVDALPMGPSHKVLKRELRAQFGTAVPASAAPSGPTPEEV
ncbi:long-chain-fatty-acid--CoA ligase [Nocardioides mesophilus]|uniref:Long-chain fatty acid--CoA ligase n=1 Tax=Nocardioides mesophilus TaxID=433659 RepID=A0A7G9RB06_9ACTN|nr:long-chain fatty acid--CoA ligase [Nocardioides mesophilus]QNN52781.1 long-chain fatty acid--CoA ligase [Nocardioides mesophilus]